MNRFGWMNAKSVAAAANAASTTVANAMTLPPAAAGSGDGAIVKAGGIDLLDLLKEDLLAPAQLVNVREIPQLDQVTEHEGGLRVGAAVTLETLSENAAVRARYPALADALSGSASPQLRHVATIGGNLLQRPRCWYFRGREFRCLRRGGGHCFAIHGENRYHAIFDNRTCAIVHPSTSATVLVALGASVELIDAAGGVRHVRLEDFFVSPERDVQRENDLKPHEILTAVHLPAPPAGARMAHIRRGEKDSFDWPLADVAVVLDLADDGSCRSAAVVLGAAAPVPHRAKAAEQALAGKPIDDALAAQAARAALAGATPLSGNAYKLPLFETLVRRAILRAAHGA